MIYILLSIDARVSSFVAKDIGNTLSGSDKALFNLGVVSGENTIIRQFKVIFQSGLVV